jgi:hypothetical protein
LRPETFVGRERVHADAGAHFVELREGGREGGEEEE